MDIIDTIRGLSNKCQRPQNEYLGEDGLLHCSVCHELTEYKMNFCGYEETVRCACDCISEKRREWERERFAEKVKQHKEECFASNTMIKWNFENDAKENPKISETMKNYVNNFKEFKEDGKGLLLSGKVGTGKTYYAACIANALMEKGYRVYMTNFSRLANKLQSTFTEKQDIIDDLNSYHLIIIDDLGAERNSEYMREIVYNIIDTRYVSGRPFIITTNLSIDDIKKPNDVVCSRIYDRILERCFPVVFDGVSMRRKIVREYYEKMKAKLGI